MADPHAVTTTQELLAQVRDELRTLNTRLGEGVQPSWPAVADGLRVHEPDEGTAGDDQESDAYCAACDRTFASPTGLAAHNRAKHGG